MLRRSARLLAAIAVLIAASDAHAHKPSDSYLTLTVAGAQVTGQWDIALRDLDRVLGLDANADGAITWGEVRERHRDIAAYALSRLSLAADGEACPIATAEQLIDRHSDGAYSVLRFTARCAREPAHLQAQQGIYELEHGLRVFAGQRDETFYIDLGATFDTIDLRRDPPVLGDGEDGNDFVNPFGVDHLSGYNVSTIALEIPIAHITHNPKRVLGLYASTSRQKFTVQTGSGQPQGSGPWVQVSRMANPLVNELIIGLDHKDLWNATEPEQEAAFLDFYVNSRLAIALNLRYGTDIPTTGRTDLVNALLKYPSQPQTGNCTRKTPCSELLRLNLSVPPTSPDQQKRLSVLAGDAAGWPNGRRPNDDVTDIALRVVAGVLITNPPKAAALKLGDGVNFNIGAEGNNLTRNGIYTKFPFLPTPHDGRNRRHVDCGETDANPC